MRTIPIPRPASGAIAAVLALVLIAAPVRAGALGDDNAALLRAASKTLDDLLTDSAGAAGTRAAIAGARGALIFPGDTGAYGAGSGGGLLFGRDAATGIWTGPAIYNVLTGSLDGAFAGGDGGVVFIVRSDVERLIAQRTRIGGSGVSVGVLSGGTLPQTDLVALPPGGAAAGAGANFTDMVFAHDRAATDALYGRPLTIREAVASIADAGEDVASLRRVLDEVSDIH